MRHRAVQLRDSLDPGLVTLAEMLQARGLVSGIAGLLQNGWVIKVSPKMPECFRFLVKRSGLVSGVTVARCFSEQVNSSTDQTLFLAAVARRFFGYSPK